MRPAAASCRRPLAFAVVMIQRSSVIIITAVQQSILSMNPVVARAGMLHGGSPYAWVCPRRSTRLVFCSSCISSHRQVFRLLASSRTLACCSGLRQPTAGWADAPAGPCVNLQLRRRRSFRYASGASVAGTGPPHVSSAHAATLVQTCMIPIWRRSLAAQAGGGWVLSRVLPQTASPSISTPVSTPDLRGGYHALRPVGEWVRMWQIVSGCVCVSRSAVWRSCTVIHHNGSGMGQATSSGPSSAEIWQCMS